MESTKKRLKTAEDIILDKNKPIVWVHYDETIQEAVAKMVEKKIGAVLIRKDDEYVGIWTERDLMRNVLDPNFNIQTARIGEYMTKKLISAPHDATIENLQDMFLGLFIRHMIINKESEIMGFISAGDVIRASLLEKDHKYKELNSSIGWDYYENWRWGRRR